jgi:hypothetical protein
VVHKDEMTAMHRWSLQDRHAALKRTALTVVSLVLCLSGLGWSYPGRVSPHLHAGWDRSSASAAILGNVTGPADEPSLPIRAAFYYPWFPEGWDQHGTFPYTHYEPVRGYYDSGDEATIRDHIEAMQYGHIQAGIASWWGVGTATDLRMPEMLDAAKGSDFRWALYDEAEGVTNPPIDTLTDDLMYINDHYAHDPAYLRIDGRFVLFVYAESDDDCGMVDRWHQANVVGAFIVLRVFPGFASCANQPDCWHQYAPAEAADIQPGYSYSISPGFWKVGEPARLARDPERWSQNIRDMVASGAPFQLITSFNEWGEGTAIENAAEWTSASGFGQYLDALHANGEIENTPPSIDDLAARPCRIA